ncbi:MAG TPA: hypothetical protein VL362_02990 [Patescibacteria group bacterium]|nr:hypothetical protein [Patescibacteria group bacterium]
MRSTSLIISAAVIGSTLAGGSAYATPGQTHSNNANKSSHTSSKHATEHRYTLCHATNSATNPYVKITVDYDSIVKHHGHGGHDGTIATSVAVAQSLKADKTSWGDVIPPIREHGFAGQNYTTQGQKLLNEDCAMPSVHGTSSDSPDCDKPQEHKHDDKKDTPKPRHEQKDDCDKDTTPVGGKGSSETPQTPTTPRPAVQTPAASVVSAPGVATELPETGPSAFATLALYIAGATATAATYGGQFIRKSLFSR